MKTAPASWSGGRPWRRARAAAPWTLALLVASCGADPPAGRLTVEPDTIRLAYGESRTLHLTFEPLRELDKVHGEPTVFVHLMHPVEKTLRTYDHALPDPWKPGVPVSDEVDVFRSALGEPLPPGTYRLGVGLYDPTYGYRWPLETAGQEADRREYLVATVEILAPSPDGPAFEFTGAWAAPELLDQKQFPVRRCLTGPAALRVSGVPAGASLRLRLASTAPTLVAGDCVAEPRAAAAALPQWLDFPLPSAPCELTFTPPPSPLACLEALTWHPTP